MWKLPLWRSQPVVTTPTDSSATPRFIGGELTSRFTSSSTCFGGRFTLARAGFGAAAGCNGSDVQPAIRSVAATIPTMLRVWFIQSPGVGRCRGVVADDTRSGAVRPQRRARWFSRGPLVRSAPMKQLLSAAVRDLHELLPKVEALAPQLQRTGDAMLAAWARGGKVMVAGNGGSAADAMHLA